MSQISYDEIKSSQERANAPRVQFFALKNDGDEAVVRIMHTSPNDFDILAVHPYKINGKFRKINCLRNAYDPIEQCPLCQAETQLQRKVYIHLLQYVKQEDGSIKCEPKIWERPISFLNQLKNLTDEYNPLCDSIFKIKRNGVAGSMDTTYSIMFANPAIYRPDLYVTNEELTKNIKALGTSVFDYTAEQMMKLLNTDDSHSTEVPASAVNSVITPQPTIESNTYRSYDPSYNQAVSNEQHRSYQPNIGIGEPDTLISRPRRLD